MQPHTFLMQQPQALDEARERLAVGEWIGRNLSDRNMTPRQLSVQLDTSESLVRKWLKGKNAPSLVHYTNLCRVFGSTPPHLVPASGTTRVHRSAGRRHIREYLPVVAALL